MTTFALSHEAAAVDVESSDLVSGVRFAPTSFYFDLYNEDQVALLGREQCVKLFDRTSPISFYFNFSNSNALHSARFFAVETGNDPANFQCDLEERTSCTDIEDITEFRLPDQNDGANYTYGRTIDFDELVQEAVEFAGSDVEPIQNAQDCTELEVDQQYFVRLIFQSSTGSARGEIFDAVIELDLEPPASPDEVTDVVVTENTIFASWEQQDTAELDLDVRRDAERKEVSPFVVFYSTRDITGMSREAMLAAEDVYDQVIILDDPNADGPNFSGSAAIRDIDTEVEGQRIWVAIAARDEATNISEPVFPSGDGAENGFEPIPVIDFWEGYKESGGAEAGGCNTSQGEPALPSSLLFAALGLGFLGWRRRRRLRRVLPVALAALAFGAVALPVSEASAQSPTWGMIELRFGGYYPAIDDEEGLAGTPFQDTFGESNRVLVEYEQGIHLLDGEFLGALGASGSIGYTHFGGGVELPEDVDVEGLDESTGFMTVPLRAGLYYRLAQLERLWSIPLVPYVKGGLDYVLWQVEEPNGDAASADGVEGEGGTFGWHAAGGLQLQLDWIDPSSAAIFDYNWGINHSYVFAEYSHMEIDDFGSSESFILSDTLWMFGLAFEY